MVLCEAVEGFPAASLWELLGAGEGADGVDRSLNRGPYAHSMPVITLLNWIIT